MVAGAGRGSSGGSSAARVTRNDSAAIAAAMRTTALSGRGIEPWPGSPVKRARTQHRPFSATCTG